MYRSQSLEVPPWCSLPLLPTLTILSFFSCVNNAQVLELCLVEGLRRMCPFHFATKCKILFSGVSTDRSDKRIKYSDSSNQQREPLSLKLLAPQSCWPSPQAQEHNIMLCCFLRAPFLNSVAKGPSCTFFSPTWLSKQEMFSNCLQTKHSGIPRRVWREKCHRILQVWREQGVSQSKASLMSLSRQGHQVDFVWREWKARSLNGTGTQPSPQCLP